MEKITVSGVLEYIKSNPSVAAGIVVTAVIIVMTPVVLQFALGGKSARRATALDAVEYRRFKLSDKIEVSHNTRIFRFALDHPEQRLGLPIGRHISIKASINGKDVRRPYTPISSDDDLGYFDLLIKLYPEPHGVMPRYLDSLAVGKSIEVRGPSGNFKYAPNMRKTLCMIAGGTGLTPMWQVFNAVLKDPLDTTEIRFIFANVKEEDILLRDRLDEIHKAYPKRFSLYHVLNEPPSGWEGGVGFVSEDMIREHIGVPEGADHKMVLLCGPPPMTTAMRNLLNKIGFSDAEIFKF